MPKKQIRVISTKNKYGFSRFFGFSGFRVSVSRFPYITKISTSTARTVFVYKCAVAGGGRESAYS